MQWTIGIDENKPWNKDPIINQPVFHGMSAKGFDHDFSVFPPEKSCASRGWRFFLFRKTRCFVFKKKSIGISKGSLSPEGRMPPFYTKKASCLGGELAHLGGDYAFKFFMEKTQLKRNKTTTPARFGCPDQQQIYQSPWWKKPRIHPLGAHPNQVEARTLRWWGVSPAWKIHWITISHPESLKMAACASRPCVSSDACTLGWEFNGWDLVEVGGYSSNERKFTRWSDEKRTLLGCF